MQDKIFYVYQLRNPLKEGSPVFYIGKGYGRRTKVHIEKARRGDDRNLHKMNTIRSILKSGLEVVCDILQEGLTETEAFQLEIDWIQRVGRANLTNRTDGGDGPTGMIHSEETLKKMSVKRKGVPKSEEWKKVIAEGMTGSKNPMFGKKHTQDRRNQIKEIFKKNHSNFGKKPWLTTSGAKFPKTWLLAQDIYQIWFDAQKNKPCGASRLSRLVKHLEITSVSVIVLCFIRGWVPSGDPEWISWKNSQS